MTEVVQVLHRVCAYLLQAADAYASHETDKAGKLIDKAVHELRQLIDLLKGNDS